MQNMSCRYMGKKFEVYKSRSAQLFPICSCRLQDPIFPLLGNGHTIIRHSKHSILARSRLRPRPSRDQVLRAGQPLVIDQVRDELINVAVKAVNVVARHGQEGEDGIDAVAAGVDVPAVARQVDGGDGRRGAVGAVVGADGTYGLLKG